jgi:hypothetical protein
MKIKYMFPILFALLLGANSCDKDFVEINTNPVAATTLDPAYQLAQAQFNSIINDYTYQGMIIQQINTPYGGVLEGGNRNTYIDANASPFFSNLYGGPIRDLTDIVSKLKDNTSKTNLYNMARIWRAYCFQYLVDTYGDVPYSEAGNGFLNNIFLPKYDDQKVIYAALLKEYEEATDALDATKDAVPGEIFYKGDIAKWKKLGNSLLLRAGMRYTKYDNTIAGTTVAKALNSARGGVFSSNADNVMFQYNATFTYGIGGVLNSTERANYYLGAPFIDYLKLTNDPRISTLAAKYPTPSNPVATAGTPNTALIDQQGMPYGYDENGLLTSPGYPGKIGSAFKYSQLNRATVAAIDGKAYLITYAQTLLLMAEARERGYITTGTTKDYYESGIKAHMTQLPFAVPTADQNTFLAGPDVAFDPAKAYKQINEQYWVASFMIWSEAWANFRRSGYPALTRINYPGEDPAVKTASAGGFIHKLPYPNRERSVNSTNFEEAKTRMGSDDLGTRLFWDKQ